MWYVYILECNDRTYYTGITTDLKKRVEQHNTSIQGAKYTSGRRPVKMVYSLGFGELKALFSVSTAKARLINYFKAKYG
jgi:putative endonuclease